MKESFKTARKGLVVTRESILPWSNIIWLSWVGGGGIKIMNDCDILVDMKFSLPKVYQQKISLIPSIYVEISDLFNKQNLILKEMLTDLLSTNKQTRKRNKVHWKSKNVVISVKYKNLCNVCRLCVKWPC